jgi:hypothetical protein
VFKEITIAATLISASICSAPSVAQTIAADHESMAPPAQQGDMIVVTAKMPVNVPKPRSEHVVTNSELDEQRGGEQLIITNQTLTAITQGNVLNGDFLAGDVNLSDSALSSFNGVGNILINTGAQVSLQTGMNLTINIGK